MFEFYCIGGIIGVLINLRFMLPRAYFEIKDASGLSYGAFYFFDTVRCMVFFLILILLGSCVAFFVSWVSVGYFMLNYFRLKEEIEQLKDERGRGIQQAPATPSADPGVKFPSMPSPPVAAAPVGSLFHFIYPGIKALSVSLPDCEAVISMVSPDGRPLTEEEAIQQYEDTGETLGTYQTQEEADAAAAELNQPCPGAGPQD